MSDFMIGLPPESKWQRGLASLKKLNPVVQATIIAGIFSLAGILLGYQLQSSGITSKVSALKDLVKKQDTIISNKTSEIQRLETLLTPFRTIALEKFTGNEKEALRELVNYVDKLQEKDKEQAILLKELETQLEISKEKTSPPVLKINSVSVKKTERGYQAIIPFQMSNNNYVDLFRFKAQVVSGDCKIIGLGANHSTFTGGHAESDDQKIAITRFRPIAGNPVIQLTVSNKCVVELTGSHFDKRWEINIK